MNRRHCIALGAVLASSGICNGVKAATAPAKSPAILVLGDSLSAEYGIRRGSGWVALLEQKLQAEKIGAKVVNASISGDTTSGGRSRLPALLKQHRPTLVVVELGGNDALRGLPLDQTQNNLLAITRMAQQNGAKVVLLGMQMPPNYGRDYAQRFSRVYTDVAKATRAILVPFFSRASQIRATAWSGFRPTASIPKKKPIRRCWPMSGPHSNKDCYEFDPPQRARGHGAADRF